MEYRACVRELHANRFKMTHLNRWNQIMTAVTFSPESPSKNGQTIRNPCNTYFPSTLRGIWRRRSICKLRPDRSRRITWSIRKKRKVMTFPKLARSRHAFDSYLPPFSRCGTNRKSNKNKIRFVSTQIVRAYMQTRNRQATYSMLSSKSISSSGRWRLSAHDASVAKASARYVNSFCAAHGDICGRRAL